MASDDLDSPVAVQDASPPESPPIATSVPADAPVGADLLAADALDETLDETDVEAQTPAEDVVYLTRAQYDEIMANRREWETVQREKATIERDKADARRAQEYGAVESEFARARNIFLAHQREGTLTDEIVHRWMGWVDWRTAEVARLKNEEIAARDYAIDQASRPNYATYLIDKHHLTPDQGKRLKQIVAANPAGAEVAALIWEEENQERAKATARGTKAKAAVTTKAQQDARDRLAAKRIATGADTLGGRGTPTAALPFKLGSDEHLFSLMPGVFKRGSE